jgi:hypothetical protein
MNTFIHADIFFFVATIGFSILFVGMIVGLYYIIGILKSARRVSLKIEESVDNLSVDAKEFFGDIRQSLLYRMLFSKRRSSKK